MDITIVVAMKQEDGSAEMRAVAFTSADDAGSFIARGDRIGNHRQIGASIHLFQVQSNRYSHGLREGVKLGCIMD